MGGGPGGLMAALAAGAQKKARQRMESNASSVSGFGGDSDDDPFGVTSNDIATKKIELFSDVVKKAQMETVELMVLAGKDMTKDASEAVKKTTKDVTAASKKMATVK